MGNLTVSNAGLGFPPAQCARTCQRRRKEPGGCRHRNDRRRRRHDAAIHHDASVVHGAAAGIQAGAIEGRGAGKEGVNEIQRPARIAEGQLEVEQLQEALVGLVARARRERAIRCRAGQEGRKGCQGQQSRSGGGNGDIQTDEYDYNLYFICTWSKQLQERCELTENTLEPAVSEYTFDELRDQYIILHLNDELHLEFVEEIEINEVYCITFNDNPRLTNIYRGVTSNQPSMLPYQQ